MSRFSSLQNCKATSLKVSQLSWPLSEIFIVLFHTIPICVALLSLVYIVPLSHQRPKYPCWGPNGTKRAAKRPTSCCCVPCVASPRASQALRSFSRGIAWERVETGRIQGRIKWIKVLRYVLVEIYTWHTLGSLLTILIGLLPSNEISTIMAPTSKHVQQPCRHQPGHCQLLGERCQHCRHCRCSRSLRCLCSATTSNEQ